jgi:hypothetical protein
MVDLVGIGPSTCLKYASLAGLRASRNPKKAQKATSAVQKRYKTSPYFQRFYNLSIPDSGDQANQILFCTADWRTSLISSPFSCSICPSSSCGLLLAAEAEKLIKSG